MRPVLLPTDRLLLRPPRLDDADAITRACQDPVLQRRIPVPVPYTRADALRYVTDFAEPGWATGTRCTWVMEHGGELAGSIGVDAIADGAATIGYWVSPEWRGQGFVVEAGRAVVDFAFRPVPGGLGLQRLGWQAFAGNAASAAVARKLGFRFEGTVRLGSMGRAGREDDWIAGLLAGDSRDEQTWPDLG
ncbi:GNAT family N-acetyltransferase [Amycolatopsis antarctica]|uniref:GNAT family N-acetyltransferase n=1 Tax=Amycolatopsis antarctica TaxID=1854586 RepID=A0A263D3N5_9PSEU|nr:GNAT family N-acetyltransferase [Amycolatopsis antarctica]OZM71975.1 GNAT family N-acetyltransferase [Amycolatopsis antarctica]